MDKVKSFEIDHTKLKKGLYISRVDVIGEDVVPVVTYDLRMCTPYKDKPFTGKVAHALEHCLATSLRSHCNNVLYVGPMGCQTGFYVVLYGETYLDPLLVKLKLIECLQGEVSEWLEKNEIPAATKVQCGNFSYMDAKGALKLVKEYLGVLYETKTYAYEDIDKIS